MTETHQCPSCGAPLPAGSPQGLCPKCLLQQGFESHASQPSASGSGATASHSSAPRFVAPTPELLAPHFPLLEILELLGQGGMGAVYKVLQPRLDRLVALKILPLESAQDPAFAERFLREARALARLSHPHIVAIFDFGEAGGFFYFLMEHVDGLNLRQMLRAGEMSPRDALAIVPQICEALQYAHDEGFVHRDIKPENILIDRRGRVKIADFGLAKLLARSAEDLTLTGTQQVMGTPQYMAPEQIETPQQIDHRADIYSLGVVFYEMLTGELPLGRFQPPSRRKINVDVRLDEVVLRSLEKQRERRYQRASEVKTDVESISSGGIEHQQRAPTPREIESPEPATRKTIARRLRFPALGIVAAGIIDLALPVFGIISASVGVLGGIGPLEVIIIPWFAILGIIKVIGGLRMLRLRSPVLAETAAAVSLLPCSPSFLIGMPMGIWSLVLLNKPEIATAFAASKPRLAHTRGQQAPGASGAVAQGRYQPNWTVVAFVLVFIALFSCLACGGLYLLLWRMSYTSLQTSDQKSAKDRPHSEPYSPAPAVSRSVPTLADWRHWDFGPEGPEIDAEFVAHALDLSSAQIDEINRVLREVHKQYLTFEAEQIDQSHDEAGHRITTVGPVKVEELENSLWTQLDAILATPERQALARNNLHFDPKYRKGARPGVWNADAVQPGLFGWSDDGARIEMWRVGQWYHWAVTAGSSENNHYRAEEQGPELPLVYRRFWNAPGDEASEGNTNPTPD